MGMQRAAKPALCWVCGAAVPSDFPGRAARGCLLVAPGRVPALLRGLMTLFPCSQAFCDDASGLKFNPVLYPKVRILPHVGCTFSQGQVGLILSFSYDPEALIQSVGTCTASS